MQPGVGKIRVLTVCDKGDMGFWHTLIYCPAAEFGWVG